MLKPVTGSRLMKCAIFYKSFTGKYLKSAYLLNIYLYCSKSVGSNYGFFKSDFNCLILPKSSGII